MLISTGLSNKLFKLSKLEIWFLPPNTQDTKLNLLSVYFIEVMTSLVAQIESFEVILVFSFSLTLAYQSYL